jgi:type II secretory pathway pseudopilin PulG
MNPSSPMHRYTSLSAAKSGSVGEHFPRKTTRRSAFTMIEIAISLAVIGFALVAIIGILPTGMNVQRDNREETIINQDVTVFMNAIRGGARGVDDLTNYVTYIRRATTKYYYTGQGVTLNSTATAQYTNSPYLEAGYVQFPITNGWRIVGLLSTPKYLQFTDNGGKGYYSNNVIAHVRALSGMASEKVPQNNRDVRELAFSYRLIADVVPWAGYHPTWTNVDPAVVTDTNIIALHSNYWNTARNLQGNLHDLRLTFRWPLLARNELGNGRQTYRTMVSGGVVQSNEVPVYPDTYPYTMFFFDNPNYNIVTNAP